MLNDHEFQEKAAEAIGELETQFTPLADEHGFDLEPGGGMLTISFEDPAPSKFIISPNTPARQIWVSALSTSYKFGWDESAHAFVLDKTGERFDEVMKNLLDRQLNL